MDLRQSKELIFLVKYQLEILENGSNVARSVDDLKKILADNPEMLDKFIVDTVSLDTLEKWVQKRSEMLNIPCRLNRGKNKLAKWKVKYWINILQQYHQVVPVLCQD